VPGDAFSQSIADVAIIDQAEISRDQAGTITSERRRLTISEPAIGYPNKFRGSTWNERKQQYEAQGASRPIDIPLDGPIGGQAALDRQDADWPYAYDLDEVLTQIRSATPDAATAPRGDSGAFYKSVYLQRLANPLQAWNPEPGHPDHDPELPVNPYMTVDFMPTNLTVFNSRGDDQGREEIDADHQDGKEATEPRNNFVSVQRGMTLQRHAQTAGGAGAQDYMPSAWPFEIPNLVRDRPPQFVKDMLKTPRNLYRQMSLQALNDYWFNAVPEHSLGFLNRPYQARWLTDVERQVIPAKPFEWLTWNNRPYASSNELLMVPGVRSSQLLKRFANGETPPPGQPGWSPYDPTAEQKLEQALKQPNTDKRTRVPFTHLGSLLHEQVVAGSANTNGLPLNMYRLLEYVHTPSLFVGTNTWLNPEFFYNPGQTNPNDPLAVRTTDDPRLLRLPPFNTASEFRDPGRVNINTIAAKEIWDGLFHGSAKRDGGNNGDGFSNSNDRLVHPGPDDDELASSRRGYGTLLNDPTLLLGTSPTIFANPFRSPDAGNLVPLQNMMRAGVECTLQRSDSLDPGTISAAPLFAAETSDKPRTEDPDNNDLDEVRDSDRNPFFRYQPMMRVDNLVTTRSNVYAVWITIGFFEVEPVPAWNNITSNTVRDRFGGTNAAAEALYNRVYPNGYALGREDGIDTGDVRRVRGFYILDRTMPAAFEPGIDHNVENVIRLRRRIE
jgi:hypothetical protein